MDFFESCPQELNAWSLLSDCQGGWDRFAMGCSLPPCSGLPLIQLKAPLLESCSQGERYAGVSLYIFGASSAVAGLLAALYLTESLGSPLPDTLEVFAKLILTFIFVISLSRIWRG